VGAWASWWWERYQVYNHFNRIELTMEFWKENTNMSMHVNFLFEEQYLELEIILLTEEPGHATIIILEWAD
jgi:hypothetical protein